MAVAIQFKIVVRKMDLWMIMRMFMVAGGNYYKHAATHMQKQQYRETHVRTHTHKGVQKKIELLANKNVRTASK